MFSRVFLRAALFAVFAVDAHAVGDHSAMEADGFQVPGDCDTELRAGRHGDAPAVLAHAGGGCRIGPMAFDLALEHTHANDDSISALALQFKWARALEESSSFGALIDVTAPDISPDFPGGSANAQLSWAFLQDFTLHTNLRRAFDWNEVGLTKAGLSMEWSALESLNLIGERFREGKDDYLRLGFHWTFDERSSIELNSANALQSPESPRWTLGLNWALE